MADIKDVRKLPPEERIRRLKEIAEKDKKEIEEAQKMIAESEAEADEEQKKYQDIPVPQMRAIDISQLFSPEEKEQFRQKRPGDVRRDKDDEEDAPRVRRAAPLEETVDREAPNMKTGEFERQQYIHHLATERPATDIYRGMVDLAREAHERGYLTSEQQNRLGELYNAARAKNENIQSGEYAANQTSSKRVEASLDLFHELKKNYFG